MSFQRPVDRSQLLLESPYRRRHMNIPKFKAVDSQAPRDGRKSMLRDGTVGTEKLVRRKDATRKCVCIYDGSGGDRRNVE